MNSGLYKIINKHNGKFYIGQAIDFDTRKANHFSQLGLNKHDNNKLQNAYNKYGKENFIFEIIELIEPIKEALLIREQYYLDLHFGKNYCYNLSPTANTTLGYKHTKESKQKIKIKRQEQKFSPEQRKAISKRISGSGNPMHNKKHSFASKEKMRLGCQNKMRIFELISPDGQIHKYQNLRKFCLDYKLDRRSIMRVLDGSAIQHKGWMRFNG